MAPRRFVNEFVLPWVVFLREKLAKPSDEPRLTSRDVIDRIDDVFFDDVDGELGRRIPWVKSKKLRSGRATAYVCERGTCQFPATEASVFMKQLGEVRGLR